MDGADEATCRILGKESDEGLEWDNVTLQFSPLCFSTGSIALPSVQSL